MDNQQTDDEAKGSFTKEHLGLYAMEIRGHIIHKVSELELYIDLYIANHFVDLQNKGEEFITIVLSRLEFEDKRQVFRTLIEENNPDFKNRHPKYYADMERIRDTRNIVAHHQVDTTVEAVKNFDKTGSIFFISFKGKIKRTEYNNQICDGKLKLIYYYVEAMKLILDK